MSRTVLFERLVGSLRVALECEQQRLSTHAGLERRRAAQASASAARRSRRELLGDATLLAASAAVLGSRAHALGSARRRGVDVGIVGAGLAGLACARELRTKGVVARVYDAAERVGGRQLSLPGFFPGQVAERGGEFIDNPHKTIIGYAKDYGLTLEDVEKAPGEVFYHLLGGLVAESVVVDEFRALVPAMKKDLIAISNEPTADAHTDADVDLDQTSIEEYLVTRGAGPIVRAAIDAAYVAEFGRAIGEQSALNFLLFIHADRRSKFTPFGIFSDERYHVVEGNDRIAQGLASELQGQLELGLRLVRVAKTAAGQVALTLQPSGKGAKSVTRVHDAVVLSIPFTVLRGVELDLALSPAKRAAIDLLGYGTNAKTMVGFSSRPWAALGGDGASYSDLANHQTTWETSPTTASATRAIVTDYSGAARGAALDPKKLQLQVGLFLGDLERVFSGAKAAATRDSKGKYLAFLEHWPSNALTLGSYTCYLRGQFTTIAGNEGKPAGNVYFAGEHANSFYEYQGFMEGAALSGIDAASAIFADFGVKK